MYVLQVYRWKRSLDQGLKEPGELAPKSHVLGLQKRVEELERALGRQVPGWIEHDNREALLSSLGRQSPAEFYAAWLVKNKTQPFQN